MPLTPCPACGRQISTEAVSCPQCGHPQGASERAPTERKCYACAAIASETCERCGAPACAKHLKGGRERGAGTKYQLLCKGCRSDAKKEETSSSVLGCVILGGGIGICVLLVGWYFWLAPWLFGGNPR
jgi:hypothetical protein